MRTPTTALATLALSLSVLTACGGDSEEPPDTSTPTQSAEGPPTDEAEGGGAAYCDVVEEMEEPFRAFVNRGDATRAEEALDALAEVPPQAPEEVREAWASLADAFNGARDTVESYGIDFQDFVADREAALDGLAPSERQQLLDDLGGLRPDDSDLADAEASALEDCGIDLDAQS